MTVNSSRPEPGPPTPNGNPTVICEQCDPAKPVTTKNFKAHQRNVHSGNGGTVTKIGQRAFKTKAPARYRGGTARKRTARAVTRRDVAVPVVLTDADGKLTFRVLDNFIVLAGSDGHIYVAERIK